MDKAQKPKISIVDENDKVIGAKDRGTLEKNDIYRVSALWITNTKGEILLARRHRSKKHDPLKWGPAVAGTVEEGETYEENIVKEAEEELGLVNIILTLGPKVKVDNEYHHFTQWYLFTIDKNINEFTIQEDEVEEIQWTSPKDLKRQLEECPEDFLSSMKERFNLFVPKP